jgi:hypothetical protein
MPSIDLALSGSRVRMRPGLISQRLFMDQIELQCMDHKLSE